MKIYLVNWTDYSGAEEQVVGFTSLKNAQAWIHQMTKESIEFAGEDKTSSMIQTWDTSQTKSRGFITLHG